MHAVSEHPLHEPQVVCVTCQQLLPLSAYRPKETKRMCRACRIAAARKSVERAVPGTSLTRRQLYLNRYRDEVRERSAELRDRKRQFFDTQEYRLNFYGDNEGSLSPREIIESKELDVSEDV
jgi:hypothetical protein